MKEQFIELLKSTNREGIENLLAFLEKTDFYAVLSRILSLFSTK